MKYETHGKAERLNQEVAPMPPEVTERAPVQAMADIQNEIFDALEEMNREWFSRARTEATAACELANKLIIMQPLLNTKSAYQQWMTRRMETFSEDSQRYFAGSQKFMQATTRLLSNNWDTNGR